MSEDRHKRWKLYINGEIPTDKLDDATYEYWEVEIAAERGAYCDLTIWQHFAKGECEGTFSDGRWEQVYKLRGLSSWDVARGFASEFRYIIKKELRTECGFILAFDKENL